MLCFNSHSILKSDQTFLPIRCRYSTFAQKYRTECAKVGYHQAVHRRPLLSSFELLRACCLIQCRTLSCNVSQDDAPNLTLVESWCPGSEHRCSHGRHRLVAPGTDPQFAAMFRRSVLSPTLFVRTDGTGKSKDKFQRESEINSRFGINSVRRRYWRHRRRQDKHSTSLCGGKSSLFCGRSR